MIGDSSARLARNRVVAAWEQKREEERLDAERRAEEERQREHDFARRAEHTLEKAQAPLRRIFGPGIEWRVIDYRIGAKGTANGFNFGEGYYIVVVPDGAQPDDPIKVHVNADPRNTDGAVVLSLVTRKVDRDTQYHYWDGPVITSPEQVGEIVAAHEEARKAEARMAR